MGISSYNLKKKNMNSENAESLENSVKKTINSLNDFVWYKCFSSSPCVVSSVSAIYPSESLQKHPYLPFPSHLFPSLGLEWDHFKGHQLPSVQNPLVALWPHQSFWKGQMPREGPTGFHSGTPVKCQLNTCVSQAHSPTACSKLGHRWALTTLWGALLPIVGSVTASRPPSTQRQRHSVLKAQSSSYIQMLPGVWANHSRCKPRLPGRFTSELCLTVAFPVTSYLENLFHLGLSVMKHSLSLLLAVFSPPHSSFSLVLHTVSCPFTPLSNWIQDAVQTPKSREVQVITANFIHHAVVFAKNLHTPPVCHLYISYNNMSNYVDKWSYCTEKEKRTVKLISVQYIQRTLLHGWLNHGCEKTDIKMSWLHSTCLSPAMVVS